MSQNGDYSVELYEAKSDGQIAHDAIHARMDRRGPSLESVPAELLERNLSELRNSRERLLKLRRVHGNARDINDAIDVNTAYYTNLTLQPPDDTG